jgi:chromosome segregation ATPase
VQTSLLDYESLYKRAGALPRKLSELAALKARVERETDPRALRAAFTTVTAILETVLLFNDFLIQRGDSASPVRKASRSARRENAELRAENERLIVERDDVRRTVANLTAQVDSAERAVGDLAGQLRGAGSSGELAELEREKERLTNALAKLRNRFDVQDQTVAATEELQTRLRHINRQYRIVKQAIDGFPRPEDYPDGGEIEDLQTALKLAKQENALLKDQISQLQLQIANQQTATSQKDQQTDRLLTKLRDYKQKTANAGREAGRRQSEIEELRVLYRQAAEQIDRLSQAQEDLAVELKHSKKKTQALADENEELKLLLERANQEAKRQMDDNVVLVRRLRKADGGARTDHSEEIRALKEQLRSALELIDRLQREIADFKSREVTRRAPRSQGSISGSGRRSRPPPSSHEEETATSEGDALAEQSLTRPELDALDSAIRQLEVTIHQSRKSTGLSASSG